MFTYLDALFQEIERGKLRAISSPVTLAESGLTQNIHIWWFVGAIPPWLPLSIVLVRKS